MGKSESWNQTYGSPDGGDYGRSKRPRDLDHNTKPGDPKIVISYLKNMSAEEWDRYAIICAPKTVYDHIKTFLDPGAVYEIRQHRREGSLR